MRHSSEHAGPRAGHRLPSKTAVLHGLPRGFQQKALLRIDRDRLPLADAEELAIEKGRVVQEPAPLAHRPTWHPWLGVVKFVGIPSVGRNLGDQVMAPQQRLPQLVRGIDAPRKPARHSDDSNRSHTRLSQGPSTSSSHQPFNGSSSDFNPGWKTAASQIDPSTPDIDARV